MKNNITSLILVIVIIILLLNRSCGDSNSPKPQIVRDTVTKVKIDTTIMHDTVAITRIERDTFTITLEPEQEVYNGDTNLVQDIFEEDDVLVELSFLVTNNEVVGGIDLEISNKKTCVDSVITNTIYITKDSTVTVTEKIPVEEKVKFVVGAGLGANIAQPNLSLNLMAGLKDKKDRIYFFQYEPIVQAVTFNVIVPINKLTKQQFNPVF